MAIPAVENFDIARIPYEGSPTFRADASYVWGRIPAVIDSMNTAIVKQNSVSDAITQSEQNTKTSEIAAKTSEIVTTNAANYKGDYNANIVYSQGESVTYNNRIYYSKVDNNTVAPIQNTTTDEWLFGGTISFTYKTITEDYATVNKDVLDIDTRSIAQVDVINYFVVVNNTDYIVTINGTDYKYTSDSNATAAEITAGIKATIDADSNVAVTTIDDSGVSVTLTAKVAGTAFSASVNNNMEHATTTANKAGPIAITLPVSPSENDAIGFLDVKGTFDKNKLTIVRNGKTIMGKAEDMAVSTKNISFGLRFTNNDWRLV